MVRFFRSVLPSLFVTLVSSGAALQAAGIPASVEATRIPNYRLLQPNLAAAGQPTPEALLALGGMGFRTVVNLRTESEGAAEERAVVEGRGLRYVSLPITPETFSLADVEAVEKVLTDSASGAILLHCASSNRVGGVWMAIQARRGRSPEEAEAAGRMAGLHSPAMQEAVRRVLGAPARAGTTSAPVASPPRP